MTTDTPPQRLLVFDDEIDVSFTLCAIAETAGFETSATTSSADFFHQLTNWRPTHLIIDLQMPNIDGVEILHTLADLDCNATVIITSGLGIRVLEAAGRAATENGLRVSGVLPKPFTPRTLRALLGKDANLLTAPPQQSHPHDLDIGEAELQLALERQQFIPWYQPKISCASGEIVGFECLARWQHSTLGLIMPDRFIPVAERSGLINQLSRQIFAQALTWHGESFQGTPIKIALNMSARILTDKDFPRWLMEQCSQSHVQPSQVILEITETSTLEDPIAMLEFLTQFRIKGFNLSIDDFGVGYSSMIQLARLPFSEMKIDKMFIMTASQSEESQKIATAIAGLGRALELYVTAEGVEDQWTLNFLREIGCDAAQGYLIARPMAANAALAWAQSRAPKDKN
ncbi:MAG: EAL domain-containing protein [Porticoccaceae bacterium]